MAPFGLAVVLEVSATPQLASSVSFKPLAICATTRNDPTAGRHDHPSDSKTSPTQPESRDHSSREEWRRRLAIAKTAANPASSPLSKPTPRGWRLCRRLAPDQTAMRPTRPP